MCGTGAGVQPLPWVGIVGPWEREIDFPFSNGAPSFYFSLGLANYVVDPECYPWSFQLGRNTFPFGRKTL